MLHTYDIFQIRIIKDIVKIVTASITMDGEAPSTVIEVAITHNLV